MSHPRACPQCGHLSENAKDWRNPVFGRVYGALAMADRKASNNDLLDWLNSNGFANLTCCPQCKRSGHKPMTADYAVWLVTVKKLQPAIVPGTFTTKHLDQLPAVERKRWLRISRRRVLAKRRVA